VKTPGHRIQARRERIGLSRAALARKLKTSRVRIWRIETGKTPIRVDDLREFARALQVDISELVA
jgi:transcriptional regulator with XRE-family HTH domain